MKNFALIGASGYIAPRHFKAIKNTGNNLIAALDPFDSVGIIDSYFPDTDFFIEFERFDRHIEKFRRNGNKVDYVSVCTPNYLHDSHIRFGLRHNADIICEKPLVLNPWNLDLLAELEQEMERNIYSILQLRLHPNIISLKNKIAIGDPSKIYDIDLTYITSRGNWYYTSWKGNLDKSGGIATNIGIHFFDMLSWIFGDVEKNVVHIHSHDRAAGYLELKKARIRWFLAINQETLPQEAREKGLKTFRSISIEGEEIDFSSGFGDLHTTSYEEVINGNGFKIEEARGSIDIVHKVRSLKPIGLQGDYHPLASTKLSKHPFEIR